MKKKLTTAQGASVADNQNSLTAGRRGPVLIQDVHLLEKLAHFNRERIPERVVHAKGAGAHGVFRVTNDVTMYTKAAFLSAIGKETEMFIRFSTVAGELGSADTLRDPRGFAVKFYTEAGNYDLVGNNTPIFFIRDPLKFPDFIHTQKKRPANALEKSRGGMGFLVPFTGIPPSSQPVDGGSGLTGNLSSYAWVWEPYIRLAQRRGRTLLGEISFSDGSRHYEHECGTRSRTCGKQS